MTVELSTSSVSRHNIDRCTGLVSVQKNSKEVVGFETEFSVDYVANTTIRIGNNSSYFISVIESITDNTHLTLTEAPVYDIYKNVHYSVNTFSFIATYTSANGDSEGLTCTITGTTIEQNNISIVVTGTNTVEISGHYNDPFADLFIYKPRAFSGDYDPPLEATWHNLPPDEYFYDINQIDGLNNRNIEYTISATVSDPELGGSSEETETFNHQITNDSEAFGNMITSYYKGYD